MSAVRTQNFGGGAAAAVLLRPVPRHFSLPPSLSARRGKTLYKEEEGRKEPARRQRLEAPPPIPTMRNSGEKREGGVLFSPSRAVGGGEAAATPISPPSFPSFLRPPFRFSFEESAPPAVLCPPPPSPPPKNRAQAFATSFVVLSISYNFL